MDGAGGMAKEGSKAKGYLLLVLALAGVLIFLFLGKVEVSIGKDSFTAEGTLSAPVTVNYNDIAEYELQDSIVTGNRSFGISTWKIVSGKYSSSSFGVYTLFAYKDVSKFIVIRYSDSVLVFNLSSEEETVKCFEQISEKMTELQLTNPTQEVVENELSQE